jgi:hypothetical protein
MGPDAEVRAILTASLGPPRPSTDAARSALQRLVHIRAARLQSESDRHQVDKQLPLQGPRFDNSPVTANHKRKRETHHTGESHEGSTEDGEDDEDNKGAGANKAAGEGMKLTLGP